MNRAAEESARVPWLQKRDAHARVLAGLGEFVARVDAELAAHRGADAPGRGRGVAAVTGPSELPPPFDPVDLHELIAQVICADAEVVPARLVSWMNRHVPDDRAAFVLLWSLTDIAAHMLHAQIGDLPAGACASVVFEDPDSPDGPGWPERIVGQLLSCAMNDDGETRSAVVVSVVSQGQRPVAQVVGQLIGLTRSMFAQQGGGG